MDDMITCILWTRRGSVGGVKGSAFYTTAAAVLAAGILWVNHPWSLVLVLFVHVWLDQVMLVDAHPLLLDSNTIAAFVLDL